jgi:hypothetical protein
MQLIKPTYPDRNPSPSLLRAYQSIAPHLLLPNLLLLLLLLLLPPCAVVSAMGTNNWLTVIINNMLSGTALTNSTSSGAAPAAAKAAAAAAGKHASAQSTRAILLSGIPALCASVAMMLTAWHADRVNEKNWHVAVPYLIGGVALTLFTPLYKASFIAGFVILVVALTFANAAMGVINARVVGERWWRPVFVEAAK